MDYATLELLRLEHPAWRLLRSDNAALVVNFLHRVFIAGNAREIAQPDLAEALEDELFDLRERLGPGAFPKAALDYLNDWAADERGWLRKFYRPGLDEPYFDLTPSTANAIAWLEKLDERTFVGTESRLLTLFQLLQQMNEGSETDPQIRLAELHKRRDELDREMEQIRTGNIPLLEDTALRDRFQQFLTLARELLTDFRQVEQNFRRLDRRVRERISLWEGSKGLLLEEILGDRDAIADSDEGRSFRAFWDLLMSSRRQEELTYLLERVLALPAVAALKPDARTRRVHYDWLEAGEHTQRTVAQLSQQLRRFLDDQAWLENRRIMEILHSIETEALWLRDNSRALQVSGEAMTIADTKADVALPMERPLFAPQVKIAIADLVLKADDTYVDTTALFSQVEIDTATLRQRIRHALLERSQITLRDLCEMHPLEQGLAELVAYLQLASGDACKWTVNEEIEDTIIWMTGDGHTKVARLPRVIFVR